MAGVPRLRHAEGESVSDHTPGPFHVGKYNGVYTSDERSVLSKCGDAQNEANAHLLALAPSAPHYCSVPGCPGPENKRRLEAFDELVTACKSALVVGEIHFETCVLSKAVKQALLAAIAKAEGRS
jgi:hypothetical protein